MSPRSKWVGVNFYFPQARDVRTHNKMFLMDESYERAGTLGFRCVQDVEGEPAPVFRGQVPQPEGA